jgi:hypothetical protein
MFSANRTVIGSGCVGRLVGIVRYPPMMCHPEDRQRPGWHLIPMTHRILHDPGEPVPFRRYLSEGLAALDKSVLDAAGIPSYIRFNPQSEFREPAVLLVRREHLEAADEALTPIESDDDDA